MIVNIIYNYFIQLLYVHAARDEKKEKNNIVYNDDNAYDYDAYHA